MCSVKQHYAEKGRKLMDSIYRASFQLPTPVRDALLKSGETNGRPSLSAEMLFRLTRSLQADGYLPGPGAVDSGKPKPKRPIGVPGPRKK
jgi:hypothetical protein